MKKKQKPVTSKPLWLDDARLAATKMQAVEVAARLPEAYPGGMMGGSQPGKSAAKVVADAERIMAFVTKR